jgi:hypothetical protein
LGDYEINGRRAGEVEAELVLRRFVRRISMLAVVIMVCLPIFRFGSGIADLAIVPAMVAAAIALFFAARLPQHMRAYRQAPESLER